MNIRQVLQKRKKCLSIVAHIKHDLAFFPFTRWFGRCRYRDSDIIYVFYDPAPPCLCMFVCVFYSLLSFLFNTYLGSIYRFPLQQLYFFNYCSLPLKSSLCPSFSLWIHPFFRFILGLKALPFHFLLCFYSAYWFLNFPPSRFFRNFFFLFLTFPSSTLLLVGWREEDGWPAERGGWWRVWLIRADERLRYWSQGPGTVWLVQTKRVIVALCTACFHTTWTSRWLSLVSEFSL